ncbi:MAG TPA: LssY C-terminal domain-containing protein [Ktedonobacterales bacterium]|nr:LssY C-terminal domain-containing protein [Ktedonobacterales bacterium]
MSQTTTRVMRLLSWLCLVVVALLALLLVLLRWYPYPSAFPSLPRITHTASGAAGDPLNLIIVGSQPQITQSFLQAGWLIPDPITPQTSAKIAAASLAHRSYPTAPVSNLYVFGRVQDLAFEKPTNDVGNRGHIRLWQTSMLIGGQPAWIGQASYDHGIELSGTSHQPTHHIAPTVDLERNAVGADLAKTGLVVAEGYGAFTPPIFAAYNGGGDYYASDGDVRIITYTQTPLQLAPSDGLVGLVLELKRAVFLFYDAILSTPLLALAVTLLGLSIVVGGVWPALRWLVRIRGERRVRPKRS